MTKGIKAKLRKDTCKTGKQNLIVMQGTKRGRNGNTLWDTSLRASPIITIDQGKNVMCSSY